MTFLLDTHVFLWWISGEPRMSKRAAETIRNPDSELFVSAVCGWEIAIKATLGRLDLPSSPLDFVAEHLHQNDFDVLPISMHHALSVHDLPREHSDPFDRLLISQSLCENLPIITGDEAFKRYDVQVIW